MQCTHRRLVCELCPGEDLAARSPRRRRFYRTPAGLDGARSPFGEREVACASGESPQFDGVAGLTPDYQALRPAIKSYHVNFSGTSSLKFRGTKGSIGHTFMVCIHTENQNQGDFCPFAPLEISVLHESPLGHLRYGLTDVPPQPNSPPDNVFNPDRPVKDLKAKRWGC